jgi:hypothetical protein
VKVAPSIKNVNDISAFNVSDEERERLFQLTNECIVCWTNKDGRPLGMPHTFVWSGGHFWVQTTTNRPRVKALRARPETSILVTSLGTELSGTMVLAKTNATVHDGDRDLVQWILPLFFDRCGMGPDAESRAELMKLFDTPERVVLEFVPEDFITYSSGELAKAMESDGITAWSKR